MGKTKGFIKTQGVGGWAEGWVDGWMGEFAEVDNRFGYEKWYKGGV